MSVKLNFVTVPKDIRTDPVLQRRNKMLLQLEQQRNLALDPNYTCWFPRRTEPVRRIISIEN